MAPALAQAKVFVDKIVGDRITLRLKQQQQQKTTEFSPSSSVLLADVEREREMDREIDGGVGGMAINSEVFAGGQVSCSFSIFFLLTAAFVVAVSGYVGFDVGRERSQSSEL